MINRTVDIKYRALTGEQWQLWYTDQLPLENWKDQNKDGDTYLNITQILIYIYIYIYICIYILI